MPIGKPMEKLSAMVVVSPPAWVTSGSTRPMCPPIESWAPALGVTVRKNKIRKAAHSMNACAGWCFRGMISLIGFCDFLLFLIDCNNLKPVGGRRRAPVLPRPGFLFFRANPAHCPGRLRQIQFFRALVFLLEREVGNILRVSVPSLPKGGAKVLFLVAAYDAARSEASVRPSGSSSMVRNTLRCLAPEK